ncbi:MAG: histidyl-tRNA synthetase, partial [Bacteroidota bacterium]|nr:histidyl-tRNA synthetase [Bacteroidota bacterium]
MIQSIRGTKDILPGQSAQWQFIEKVFKEISQLYGYGEMRTPIFEKTELFSRGIGEGTDIVNKEMYTFTDRGGESITLRPEMTASIARAILQNSLLQQGSLLRIWYAGPLFRYERPQKGRLRQFHQYDAECIGSPFPESDVELILLANSLINGIGLNDYKLLINTLGSGEVRQQYRRELVAYLKSREGQLSADSRSRLDTNPLRTLDSKDPADAEIIAEAPRILDFLDSDSAAHFNNVKTMLESAGIQFEIQPRLVRGLDYYSHTVFEFQHNALGAQDSFGGGGRYDGLFSDLGGKPTPAVGFAFGIERMLLILENAAKLPQSLENTDIFIIAL